jgi:hypothetical protein
MLKVQACRTLTDNVENNLLRGHVVEVWQKLFRRNKSGTSSAILPWTVAEESCAKVAMP